jgi:hypothetical protein
MTDPLEQRLQQAATAASNRASPPPLLGLRHRSRRRRTAMIGAPLAVAGAVAAGAFGLQPQDRDRITTEPATGEDHDAVVTFTVQLTGTLAEPGASALQACTELPGVMPTGPLTYGRSGTATITVEGSSSIQTFDSCISDIAGYQVQRSDEIAAETAAARARWEAVGSSNYTYRLSHRCFCPVGEFDVTVTEGQAVSVTQRSGEDRRAPERFQLSIDDLFALIEQPPAGVSSVRAQYDARYGFPTRIDVDRDPQAIDDEYTYVIIAYQPATAAGQQAEPTWPPYGTQQIRIDARPSDPTPAVGDEVVVEVIVTGNADRDPFLQGPRVDDSDPGWIAGSCPAPAEGSPPPARPQTLRKTFRLTFDTPGRHEVAFRADSSCSYYHGDAEHVLVLDVQPGS